MLDQGKSRGIERREEWTGRTVWDEGINRETLKKILERSELPGHRLKELRPKPRGGAYLERIAPIIE